MAKRFTDTEKWKKPFIRSMKAPYKLLWLYILDECDHAGIWQVDFEVAQIKIGERLNIETARQFFSGKIFEFDEGEKWFIPDFIEFQYGELSEQNRAHNSVIRILEKYNLKEIKPLVSPLYGAMDKDKDKDKEMDKELDKDKDLETRQQNLISEIVGYVEQYGKPMCMAFFNYWSETDKKGKMRFELQKTWETGKRLATWHKNEKSFNNGKQDKRSELDNLEAELITKFGG